MANKYFKAGYCDGLLGRASSNPYQLWPEIWASVQYNLGYFDGRQRRAARNITLTFLTYKG